MTEPQQSIPKHVAIICDGNRRWAKEHKLEVFLGHKSAVDHVFEPLILHAQKRGIEYITFWVFSTENWKRNEREVGYLLDLFRVTFDTLVKRLHEYNIRIQVIGNMAAFDQDIQERISRGVELTKNNKGITAVFAMNYGGRDEIVRACNKLISQYALKIKKGEIAESTVTAETLTNALDTATIPDPDFIIRTGGEQRTSGFLSWQSEYAEYAFPEFYFPDFTPERLDQLLAEFALRKRRFGK